MFSRLCSKPKHMAWKIDKDNVMVNFNKKNRTCKIDPLFIVKSRREPYKSGYRGIDNSIYFTINRRSTHVDIYITIINRFQPEGRPQNQKFPIVIAFAWCVALKKVPCKFYVESKKEHARNATPCCSVPLITRKYASSQCLSFSTRLVPKFSPVIHLFEKEKKEKILKTKSKSKHSHDFGG